MKLFDLATFRPKRRSLMAMALIAGIGALPGTAPAAPPAYSISEGVRVNLLAAQTAIGQGNYAGAAGPLAPPPNPTATAMS